MIAEAAAAKATVVAAIFAGDQAALAPLSRAWNAGTAVTGGQPLVGSGPYTASVDGAEVTLEANPRYTGDHRPQYETVVVRVIEDPRDAIRALAGGSVDVVDLPASAANGEALLRVRGVTTVEGYDAGFEHLELKFTDSRSGLFGDPLVREAFLKVVPRQQVVDELVGPVQEDARVRSSFMFFPGSEDYTDAVTANGSAAYADVDVAGAQALLAGSVLVAGTAPQVCVLFDPTDPRRVAEFALLQQSAAPAGFVVTDCSRDDWESILTVPGAWDAALVDWPATARPVTGAVERLRSDAPANASGYASTTTDALLDRLGAERDASERGKILADVDRQLFADFYGMPLFQLPSLTAYRSDVEGIARSPLSPNLFWNLWEWHPASSD